jgi:transposase-like protein
MRRHLSPSVRAEIGLHRISVPPEVITWTARWYLRFGFSYHDVEELLAGRGIGVDHVSRSRRVQRFRFQWLIDGWSTRRTGHRLRR